MQKVDKPSGKEYEGQEVLHVRAYGTSFFILGINIRFLLFTIPKYRTYFLLISDGSVCLRLVLIEWSQVTVRHWKNGVLDGMTFLFS